MGRALSVGLSRYLRNLLGGPGELTDRDLLQAFATRRDEAAFAAIVQRHGPLVWGLCRRLLRDEQDAEDAFQATFFVLARKAGSVAWRDDAGNWLYSVALRIARKARAREQKRGRSRCDLDAAAHRAAAPEPDHEIAAVVAEEVGRLPEKYRRPMILCGLQGKSYSEAARVLGWPEGTVSGRLARARELLRQRLLRRGLGPAAVSAPPLPVPTTPSAGLAQTTLRDAMIFVAGSGLTSPAAVLAGEVLRSMVTRKLLVAAGVLLVLVALSVGLGLGTLEREAPAAPAPLPQRERQPDEVAAWATPRAWPLGRMNGFHLPLAISPDGGELVIGGSGPGGGEAYVYDLRRGKVVREFLTDETIEAATFSPDGKVLAVAEWRDGVRLRDSSTMKVLQTVTGSGKLGASQVAFSPDGKLLIGYSWFDKKRQLWVYDLAAKKELGWPAYEQNRPPSHVTERLVGRRPLLFSVEWLYDRVTLGYNVWLTDPETGKKGKPLALGKRDQFQFDVRSDGGQAVVMQPGEDARLVDLRTGKTVHELKGHERGLAVAVYSPRGQLVATATGTSADVRTGTDAPTEILLHDVATGRVIAKWENEKQLDFMQIGFSPNGRYLYALTMDHDLWLWGDLPAIPEKAAPILKESVKQQ